MSFSSAESIYSRAKKEFSPKEISALLIVLAFVAGCANNNEAEPRRYQEPRFTDQAPIDLKVNRVEVVSEFTPTFTRPNVEHLFPISIEKTARLWAKDRLKTDDYASDKIAEFIIKDASVTEEIEKSEKVFYKDRIKYRATLYVVIKVTDPKNLSSAETSIEAWRELAIPADTDIEEKERYWKRNYPFVALKWQVDVTSPCGRTA